MILLEELRGAQVKIRALWAVTVAGCESVQWVPTGSHS